MKFDIFLEGLTQMLIAVSFCFLFCCLTGFQFSLDWNFNLDGSVITNLSLLVLIHEYFLFFIRFVLGMPSVMFFVERPLG